MEVNKSAYFVEHGESPVHAPSYLATGRTGSYWTTDIFEAHRFATDELAQRMLHVWNLQPDEVRIVDHILTEAVQYVVVDTGQEGDDRPEHVRSLASADVIIRAAGEVA